MKLRFALALAAAAIVAGAAGPAARQQAHPFRSGVEIVTLAATVRDATGHLVKGLPKESFEVYEDGEPQPVTQFTNERVPISLAVLLDISDSMYGKRIDEARAAVDRFLFELLDPNDEFLIIAFNHKPHALTRWTNTPDVVRQALQSLRPSGGTAAYDAVMEAMPLIAARTRQRAALLLVSDGADTASNATLREVRAALVRSDAFAYAIALDSPDPQAINTHVNPTALREITDDSGGRTEVVRTTADLVDATGRIAEELNSQYVLGYSSSRSSDGKYHSIRVKVKGGEYRVRARSGYVATPVRRGSGAEDGRLR